ncbi:polyadenylate-binding protein rbp47c-related [Anaeramoeba ignava]|uniref:Polyadenylate-binding protein rbp47c-related n=1 Tax=Anaeramoeba ignava TaxID=1746090 RepID=A0A9Q0RAM7_ANAIG|nr:polyadenylate-binding protein rbp47c-related [Anaeramoeba ignava]
MSEPISLFVGDLPQTVTQVYLKQLFAERYHSVIASKIITDTNTGQSKGYGFVTFTNDEDARRALVEMNGFFLFGGTIRVSTAHSKTSLIPNSTPTFPALSTTPATPTANITGDASNTTVYVGKLDPTVSVEELKSHAEKFGEITYCKIPPGKGCGFVQFTTRDSAENCLNNLTGQVIGCHPVKCSWGRIQPKTTTTTTPTIQTPTNLTNVAQRITIPQIPSTPLILQQTSVEEVLKPLNIEEENSKFSEKKLKHSTLSLSSLYPIFNIFDK